MEYLIDGSKIPEGMVVRPVKDPYGSIIGYVPAKKLDWCKARNITFSIYEDCYALRSDLVLCYVQPGIRRYVFNAHILVEAINGEKFIDENTALNMGYYYLNDNLVPADYEVSSGYVSYNADSHTLTRIDKSEDAVFKIGFEIEKEDSDIYRGYTYEELYKLGWIKEGDSSLNEYGFELVSPVLPLYGNIEGELEKVTPLIDADYTESCGGHINISCTDIQPKDLLVKIKGWLPLLYAMYPERTTNRYSEIKHINQYFSDFNSKGKAVVVHNNRIEFRLFPAVVDKSDLITRLDLMRAMMLTQNKSTKQIARSKVFKPFRNLLQTDYKKYVTLCV